MPRKKRGITAVQAQHLRYLAALAAAALVAAAGASHNDRPNTPREGTAGGASTVGPMATPATATPAPAADRSPVLPMFFAGPPAGRWFNDAETRLVLRHALAVVGAGGPGGPNNGTDGNASSEAVMHEQVLRLRAAAAAAGQARVPAMYVYRNGLEALPGFAAADEAFANASMDFLWLRNTSAAGAPVCAKPQPSLGGASRFIDWRSARARAWFADRVVGEVAREAGVDGVFFDEADWATCGVGAPRDFLRAQCDPSWSEADTRAFAAGQAAGWRDAARVLARAGKKMALSLFTARAANLGAIDRYTCESTQASYFASLNLTVADVVRPYLDVLWFGPSATPSQCDAYLRNMIEDAAAGATVMTRGVIPARAGAASGGHQADVHDGDDDDDDGRTHAAKAATAAVLLAADGQTFVGLSSGWSSADWQWWPWYDAPLGQPTGSPRQVRAHAWGRNFTNGWVTFDCGARPFAGDVVVVRGRGQ